MKNKIRIILMIIIANAIAINTISAQSLNPLAYELKIEYTGQVNELGDSLFKMLYVFKASELSSFSEVQINNGDQLRSLSMDPQAVSRDSQLTELDGLLRIEVGQVDVSKPPPTVSFKDNSGNTFSSAIKRTPGLDYRSREEVRKADSFLLLETKPVRKTKDKK